MQALTLTDVLTTLHNKLDEAIDFLEEMELAKSDDRRFRHRLSAFLSASDSMTEIMGRQGMRYARQQGKDTVFETWFVDKQNLFRTPEESNPKKGKNVGTNALWVYLRAARHETIHLQQISVNVQREFKVNASFTVRDDHSFYFEVEQDDGTIQTFEFDKGQLPTLTFQLLTNDGRIMPLSTEQRSETIEPIQSPLPLLKAVDTGEMLWAFRPLTIIGQGGKEIAQLQPPTSDVVTVCKNHIQILEALIDECKTMLE